MRPVLLLLALVAACGEPADTDGPATTCPSLAAEPETVTWDAALFDARDTRDLRLSTPCDDPVALFDALIDGDDAFRITGDAAEVPAGGSAVLTLRYEPYDYGPHAAALRLDTDAGEIVVPLVGRVDPDQDGDGIDALEAGGEDCDDTDPGIGAPTDEIRNLLDDDCDGFVDEDFIGPGDMLISELMLSPRAARSEFGQWVELRNPTEHDVDITGWRLQGSSGSLDLPSLVVPAGGFVVVGPESDTAINGGIELDGVYTGDASPLPEADWRLSLTLDGASVAELDRQAWPQERGRSLNLDPSIDSGFEAATADAWCLSRSAMPNEDQGTPGAANDLCTHIDHDGDGITIDDGDCDDTDPDIRPRATEVWDGIDNDCNGRTDHLFADTAADGQVDGTLTLSGSLGRQGAVGLDDADGDGRDEIYLAESDRRQSHVWVVDVEDLVGASGSVADLARAQFSSSDPTALFSGAAPRFADVDHDGDDDVALLLSRASTGGDLLWVAEGLPLAGSPARTADDMAIRVSTSSDRYSFSQLATGGVVHLDLDGDGAADPLIGDPGWVPPEGSTTGHGRLSWLDLGGASGPVTVADTAVGHWTGGPGEVLGPRPGGGDLDDDGYDDIFLTQNAGGTASDRRVYIVPGGTDPDDVRAAEAAIVTFTDLSRPQYTGTAAIGPPLLEDLDGDGDMDLVVADPFAEVAHVFRDAADLSGSIDPATQADLTLSGREEVGRGMTLADFDDDGAPSLVLGAPSIGYPSNRGWLYAFDNDALSRTGTVYSGDGELVIRGWDAGDDFGVWVGATDVDANGRDDLLVVAPSYRRVGRLSVYRKQVAE